MIEEKLELKPLSVNRAWQGRRFKTSEYTEWLQKGIIMLPKRDMVKGEIEVSLTFYFRNSRSDIDNPIKSCLDLLVKKGYIEDDSKINSLYVFKRKSDKEYIEIAIQKV